MRPRRKVLGYANVTATLALMFAFSGGAQGTFSATAHDGSVALDGTADQGVWLQGEIGPACSFSGYTIVD